ncbi:MAG: S8 family peptidase [Actinomycetota bacterium]
MIFNNFKFNNLIAALTLFALCLQISAFSAAAQMRRQQTTETKQALEESPSVENIKIAPDLAEKTKDLTYGWRSDETQKVIIQLKTETPLNNMFGNNLTDAEQKQVFAQEVMTNREKSGILIADLSGVNGKIKKSFNNLGMVTAELPLSKINELAQSENVAYISPDRTVASTGHIAYTSGANTAWGNVSGCSDCKGTGVGVAILDSGIDVDHYLFQSNGKKNVVYSKDFTGQGTTLDKFGHGSHVASMAAGSFYFGAAYNGVAPNAKLINLRVLDDQGKGTSSNAVAAIDWAISNKAAYNIRVLNMSLGTPPKDSYLNDPLCKAARRAYNAGILVVASAGNNGKDASGNKLYGYINSPGIEPSVMTVGAVNTYGTDARTDDTVTTYSSRGPTRGYTVSATGVRNYDNLIKPDIVAQGNKLIGAKSGSQSSNSNSLAVKYPSLNVNNGANAQSGVMYLSGTSMAAPMVSGAAAILFQARPDLTPGLAKAILMYTAQPIKGANTLEQGAGILNIKGATEVLNRLKPNAASLANGSAMLNGTLTNQQGSGQCSYTWTSTCDPWGKGIITNFGFLYGDSLMTTKQGIYSSGTLVSDGTVMSGTSLVRSSSLTTSNVNVYQGAIKINSNGVLVSDGLLFLDSNSFGNDLLGNGVLVSDGTLVSDGVLVSDTNPQADDAVYGDNTAFMSPE